MQSLQCGAAAAAASGARAWLCGAAVGPAMSSLSSEPGEPSAFELVAQVLESDDHFEVLGVPRAAEDKEVTTAYRRRALRLHPDKCREAGAEEAFKKVAAAFACLRDPQAREHYRTFGRERGLQSASGARAGAHVDPMDIFAEVFEAMARAEQQRREQGGAEGFPAGGGVRFATSGPGMTFMVNGQDVLARLPAPLRALLGLVPPQLLFIGFVALLLFFASTAVRFVLQRLAYVLPIVLFVPPPFRGFLLLLVVLLGLFNKI